MKNQLIPILILATCITICYAGMGTFPRSDQSCDSNQNLSSKRNSGYFWNGQHCEVCGQFCYCNKLDGCDKCALGHGMWDLKHDDSYKKENCFRCDQHNKQSIVDSESIMASQCCITAEKTEAAPDYFNKYPFLAVRHTECSSGYQLFGSQCHKKDGCLRLNNNIECEGCISSYYWDSERFTCASCHSNITNCIECQVKNQCSKCGPGFYLSSTQDNASFKCDNCSAGCICTGEQTTAGQNLCSACLSDSYFKDSSDKSCTKCSDSIAKCNRCRKESSDVICISCDSNSTLAKDSKSCKACPTNCQKCRLNATKTDIIDCEDDGCENGYYLSKADTGNICKNCSLTNNRIARCNGPDPKDITQCQSTQSGTISEDHDTNSKPPFLNSYYLVSYSNGTKVCQLNSYSCKKIKEVEHSQYCEECYTERGYILVSAGNKPECQKCQLNQCAKCDLNATGDGLVCALCKNSKDTRESDVVGYYLDGNKLCAQCGQGCAECVDSSKCNLCLYGYKMEANNCSSNKCQIDKCSQCDASVNQCQACFSGYSLYQKGDEYKCIVCEGVCQQCQNRKICTKCPKLYYLSGGVCQPSRANCINWNTNDGSCLHCDTGFYPVNGWCKPSFMSTRAYVSLPNGCSSSWFKYDGLWLQEAR